MEGDDLAWPIDLGYIVCDACFQRDCANCVGLTHTRPFCGHRCGFLMTIDEGDSDGAAADGGPIQQQRDA